MRPGTREVWSDGRTVEVTTTEFDILELMVRSAGRIVSRNEISGVIHQRPASPQDRSLDVHISHLRRKLGSQGGLIRTIRGVGYLFCAELTNHEGGRQ
jgi:two-component system response regulator CpxR